MTSAMRRSFGRTETALGEGDRIALDEAGGVAADAAGGGGGAAAGGGAPARVASRERAVSWGHAFEGSFGVASAASKSARAFATSPVFWNAIPRLVSARADFGL